VILLDTHVIVRLLSGDPKLGKRARITIDRAGRRDELFVSAISFWEIAMLVAKHRLELDTTPSSLRVSAIEDGVQEAPIDGEIAIAAAELPSAHQDPADRLLVATAIVRGLTLLTADGLLLDWKLQGFRTQDATV
jgi:PIN domain nuclease of toxin-antitoxin system